jgi:DNA-binding MarR family transcriptional regulator
MIEPFIATFLSPTKKYRRLSALQAIHGDPNISQHAIARLTHLSSSMVNNYIKIFQKEGLIRVTGKTNRTRRYHLTTRGHEELITLLITYSAEIIQLYGAAKHQLAKRLQGFSASGIEKIILFGAAETAEVVHAALKEAPLQIVGVIDSDPMKQGMPFNGLKIQAPEALKDLTADAIVITSFGKQEEINKSIRRIMDNEVKVIKLTDL